MVSVRPEGSVRAHLCWGVTRHRYRVSSEHFFNRLCMIYGLPLALSFDIWLPSALFYKQMSALISHNVQYLRWFSPETRNARGALPGVSNARAPEEKSTPICVHNFKENSSHYQYSLCSTSTLIVATLEVDSQDDPEIDAAPWPILSQYFPDCAAFSIKHYTL